VCFGVLTFALLARKLMSFQDLNFRSGIQTENTFHNDGFSSMLSPSASSKKILSVLKFLGILKFLRYTQNILGLFKGANLCREI
jgi:hypothetical protein